MSDMVTVEGVEMTMAAAANVEACGVSPADDLRRMQDGVSAADLLAECLDGAEGDDVEAGWREYVDAIADAATHECDYCSAWLTSDPNSPVAAIGDDEAWERLARVHHRGCEWVATRAHRLDGTVS